MTIRESLEQWEKDYLSPYASPECKLKGTVEDLRNSVISGRYFNDRDRIIHCKAFRRLKDKHRCF